ncbi:hypothetical protein EMCRGX_G006629, partial [Ephydatia muelleri]
IHTKIHSPSYPMTSYTRAAEIAQSREAAQLNVQQLKETSVAVKTVSSRVDKQFRRCPHCGKNNHSSEKCSFKSATCYKCRKPGHIASVCRQKYVAGLQWMEPQDTDVEAYLGTVMTVGRDLVQPITIDVKLNGRPLKMEVDTGAALSIVSEKVWMTVKGTGRLQTSRVVLRTYNQAKLTVLGETKVQVEYGDQFHSLMIRVVKEGGPSLVGRDWLKHLRLDWKMVCNVQCSVEKDSVWQSVLSKYSNIFKPGLGMMKEITAKLKLKPGAVPQFHRARSVPFSLKGAVEQEIHRLEELGVLERVVHSEWAAPIVVVSKKDGRVRLCGDYKVTVNKFLDVDQYPLPKPNELFATLTGGKRFTKLDLSQAYTQMVLEEDSRCYVTINTHIGLFRYTRLPFGVASSPAVFQAAMDSILQGISGVICYIDDILITGKSDEQHLKALEDVLKRLDHHGLVLEKEKCFFFKDQVEYLGHIVDALGVHTTSDKLQAVKEAPTPKNVSQLRSFLGLVNYYQKFIPNLAMMLYPLNCLLRLGAKWHWTKECEKAFDSAKLALMSAKLLVHYDPELPLRLAGDASEYGIGAIISHMLPVTSGKLKAYTARDTILSQVLTYTRQGWPTKIPDAMKPFWTRRDEITIEGDCLLWGLRVLVPQKLQVQVLEELHQGHPGASRMKALARSYVWWPGLDLDLENLAKSCLQCQEVKVSPPVAPLHPWVWPAQPWQRIHIDFAGPFLGSNFLVVVDAHSKWPEVVEMKTLTSAKTIEALRELFATYGLPQQLVSDNGSQFTSEEFAQFMTTNGIKHICCAPYHPASNGLAERFVQTFKKSMLASRSDQMSFQQRLCSFLLAYRTTPHSTTGGAPCMLFFKRQLRTRLDLLKPDYGDKALGKQADQKNYHDLHSRDRQFSVGQKVMARNFLQGLTWVPGVVTEVCGPVSYMVRVQPNIVWRRHVDHIKELQEFDALRGGEEDSLRKEPVLENCAEETSIVDTPSASDSVISAGVPQEGLCPDIQVPTTEIAVQQDPGSTSDISIEQSRSAELREPSKSTELGREIATRGDVPKLASRGSGSEDHQQQTAQPEGVRRYPKREHRPPKRY